LSVDDPARPLTVTGGLTFAAAREQLRHAFHCHDGELLVANPAARLGHATAGT